MLSPVPAPGVTREPSQLPLRTDKKRKPLARRSHPPDPDVVRKTSPLCDALPQPAGKAAEDGNLTN
jgi:hypothetical protein